MKDTLEIIGSLLQRIKSCIKKAVQNYLEDDVWQICNNHFTLTSLNLLSFFSTKVFQYVSLIFDICFYYSGPRVTCVAQFVLVPSAMLMLRARLLTSTREGMTQTCSFTGFTFLDSYRRKRASETEKSVYHLLQAESLEPFEFRAQ